MNFTLNRPFIGFQSYTDKDYIYGISFLEYTCMGQNPIPPNLPFTELPKQFNFTGTIQPGDATAINITNSVDNNIGPIGKAIIND